MTERTVKVYSTPTCPWCRRVKMLLDANGVKYQDLDVAGDKAARKQMIDETHQLSVPVVVIDGAVIIGYKESEIKEKLGIQ